MTEKKIVWFVGCEESSMPKYLVHVQTKEEADKSIPSQAIDVATVEIGTIIDEQHGEGTVTITRSLMTDAEIEALPDL